MTATPPSPSPDVRQVADLAFAQVCATRPRTPGRRAAVCLYYAAAVPPAKSVDVIRDEVATFRADATQRAALELLNRLTAMTRPPEDPSHA